ncbi:MULTISPECIES: EamA family transporter [Chryseobacterium]|uniref:EamA family transporter n=1 Tax=Chryseobacterium TaxID=59732 RepID=UPI0019566080|nr:MULTISPECIES: EamA family transporter [Chryseobacterium]MBM7421328.1 drug/metabolite transporter (DMT)-like permease [Chryseobacterium sp. JUb44]MDH6211289.1 drug/metabolite transporter (DMT)-like permease [Chryseobacterium sp. BIGb0186]WSO09948.1 EamA family transporter [Chryseobacterium scophthalmum]
MVKERSGNGTSRMGIIIAYFLIFVVWGSTYYFIGVALKGLPPFLLGALRFTTAGLLLLLWCWYKGEPVFGKSLIKKSAISGIVLLFIDMAVVMLAQKYVSSSLVAIVASSTAIWIMALDMPMWKTNFRSLRTIAGIVIGFLGVLMLYIEQFLYDTANSELRQYGILLLVFGCISWAIGTLYAKYRSSHTEEANAFAGAAWQMLFASAMFWIFAFITGEVATIHWEQISYSSWFSLLYLIIFGSILAYSAYIWLLKVRPATEVATHAYVNPIVAILIGVGIGKEQVSGLQIIGLIIILSSVSLVGWKRKKRHP